MKDKINDEVKSIKSLCPSDVDEYTILKDVGWSLQNANIQFFIVIIHPIPMFLVTLLILSESYSISA